MSRTRAASLGVNLLPLLDVLLCTMGTLIIVLGVINREARLHPAKRLSAKAKAAAEHNQELADEREDLELHIRQLLTAREKTLADLETARSHLSGLEDHSRELEDQLRGSAAAASQLGSTSGQKSPEHDSLLAELQKLNARRLELDKQLKEARVAAADKKPVFAVVPFEGIYQTCRRPIYIECRGDSVILQPEGIVFTPNDFLGPGGPGNPLAAALRAAQEYWRQAPAPAPGIPNEPYPLLLVRPDGIIAYYLVRDAMSSWDAEFGYELIGADWKLDFPMQPEQRLRDMETRAVSEARDRWQWLAQNSPETFQRKSKTQYRMSSLRGGVARDGGPSLGNDPFADDPLGGFGRSTGAGPIPGNAGGAFGRGGQGGGLNGNTALAMGSSGSSYAGGNPLGGDATGTGGGDGSMASGQFARGDGRYSPGGNGQARFGGSGLNSGGSNGGGLNSGGGSSFGNSTDSTALSGNGGQGSDLGPRYAGIGGSSGPGNGYENAAAGGPNSTATGRAPGISGVAGEQRGAPGGSMSRSEYGGVAWPGGSAADSAQQGFAGSTGAAAGGGNDAGSTAGGQFARGGPSFNDIAGIGSGNSNLSGDRSAAGGGGSGGSASGSSMPSSMSASGASSGSGADSLSMSSGVPTPSLNFQSNNQPQRSSRSMAQNRGKNWALPSGSNSSLPVQRPIRIECYADRLVLLPDSREVQSEVIPLGARTDESVDQLVAAVRSYTKSWGMAGRSMYWKPQLLLEVKPDAESRAADLQMLLADSGLDVKRK